MYDSIQHYQNIVTHTEVEANSVLTLPLIWHEGNRPCVAANIKLMPPKQKAIRNNK